MPHFSRGFFAREVGLLTSTAAGTPAWVALGGKGSEIVDSSGASSRSGYPHRKEF